MLLLTAVVGDTKAVSNLGTEITITVMDIKNDRVFLSVASKKPTAEAAMENPKLAVAQRHENDCWAVLVRHTNGCPACLEQRRLHDENGLGCDTGRACKDEWRIAARRRYELESSYTGGKEDPRTVPA